MSTFMDMFSSELEQFEWSLRPRFNPGMLFKAGEGAGRSGSFFFFSQDDRYIIKTIKRSELDLYLKFLPSFQRHYQQNRHSLLARIFGVFTINTQFMKEVHVMLMENTS